MSKPAVDPRRLLALAGVPAVHIDMVHAMYKKQTADAIKEDRKSSGKRPRSESDDDEEEVRNMYLPLTRPKPMPSAAAPSFQGAVKRGMKKTSFKSAFSKKAAGQSAGMRTIRRSTTASLVAVLKSVVRQIGNKREFDLGLAQLEKSVRTKNLDQQDTALELLEACKTATFIRLAKGILKANAKAHVFIGLNKDDSIRDIIDALSVYGSGHFGEADSLSEFQDNSNKTRVLVGKMSDLTDSKIDLVDRTQGTTFPRFALISPPAYKDHLENVTRQAMHGNELVYGSAAEEAIMATKLELVSELQYEQIDGTLTKEQQPPAVAAAVAAATGLMSRMRF